MKRFLNVLCTVLLCAAYLVPAMLAPRALAASDYDLPAQADASSLYVADYAGVLTDSTKQYIVAKNADLYEATGAQIAVVTMEFIGSYEIEDYAYALFNEWGIGSSDKNNGILLLLVTGAEDYWCVQGRGLERDLSSAAIGDILYDNLETDFAAARYDAGVKKTFDALYGRLEGIYGDIPSTVPDTNTQNSDEPIWFASGEDVYDDDGNYYYDSEPSDAYYVDFSGLILTIIVIVIIVSIISRGRRRARRYQGRVGTPDNPDIFGYPTSGSYPNYPTGGSFGGSFTGSLLGSLLGNALSGNHNQPHSSSHNSSHTSSWSGWSGGSSHSSGGSSSFGGFGGFSGGSHSFGGGSTRGGGAGRRR